MRPATPDASTAGASRSDGVAVLTATKRSPGGRRGFSLQNSFEAPFQDSSTDNSGAFNARTSSVTVNAHATQTCTNNTDYPINDNTTVTSPIRVTGRSGNAPINTPVAVRILHAHIGDLRVSLIAPDGAAHVLHDRIGNNADNIITTYGVNLPSETISGNWRLRGNDNANADTGRIDSWSIAF
jgi:hypothetical protein